MSQVSRDNFKLAILTIASLSRYFYYSSFKLFYSFLWVTYYEITQSNPYGRIIAYNITFFAVNGTDSEAFKTDDKIISILKKEYKGKGKIGWIFKRIEMEKFEEQFEIYGMS